jgi:hypothetical protein
MLAPVERERAEEACQNLKPSVSLSPAMLATANSFRSRSLGRLSNDLSVCIVPSGRGLDQAPCVMQSAMMLLTASVGFPFVVFSSSRRLSLSASRRAPSRELSTHLGPVFGPLLRVSSSTSSSLYVHFLYIFLPNILLNSSISRVSTTSSTRLVWLLSAHDRHSLKLLTRLVNCEGHSLDVRPLQQANEVVPV